MPLSGLIQRTETGKGSATEAPCWNRRSTHGLRGRIHQADAQTAQDVSKESGQDSGCTTCALGEAEENSLTKRAD